MSVAERYPAGATPDQYTNPDPYQPVHDHHGTYTGGAPIDPWERLRFRWEDQLRALHPDTWTLITTELTDVETRYRAMATDLGYLRNHAAESARTATYAQAEQSQAATAALQAKDKAAQEQRRRTEAQAECGATKINAHALARALHDLALRVLEPEQASWTQVLDDDTVKLVEHYDETAAEQDDDVEGLLTTVGRYVEKIGARIVVDDDHARQGPV